MRKFSFLFAFLLSVMGVTQAWAQKALPYSYDFSTSLESEGWTTSNLASGGGVTNGEFKFKYSTNPPQYLFSPELATSSNAIKVSFNYRAYLSSSEESFKVGYSSTDNEISSFSWDEEVKTKVTTNQTYEKEFPAGTKYIAIAYTANDMYYLYVDNFKVDLVINGPGFAVEGYANGGNVDFGLAEAGATKTLTLLNPGTESVTVGIAATGGFSVSPASVTIAAKGSETVTVTMPNADATGTLTFSPAGLDAVVLNLSVDVFDPTNKFFEDFAYATGEDTPDATTNELPGWEINNSTQTLKFYQSNIYYWAAGDESANIVSPKLTVSGENEKLYVKAYANGNSSQGIYSNVSLVVSYSADKENWIDLSPTIGKNDFDERYVFKTFSFSGIPAGDYYFRFAISDVAIDFVYGFTEAHVEPSAVITNVMLPGEFNGWQGDQNELTYDATTKAYKGVLDLTNTTADQQFKLLVRAEGYDNDIYLGWQQNGTALTIDAPEGWVVDYSNDNLYLLNSATNYKTYDVTAKWTESADATTGWTLTIAGKDERYNTYTATFADNAGWGNIYAYTWTGEGADKVEQLGAWPGKKLELNADGKYEVTVLGDEAPSYIVFHNNNGTQTENLEFINGNEYNNAVLTSFAATFVNAAGWDNVYAYVWSGEGSSATNKVLGDWPGTKLTAGTDGKFAVSFEAIEAPEKIIFNNGNNGKQTGNLAFVDAKEYELFYEGFTHADGVVQDGDLEGWTVDEAHVGASGFYGTVQYYNNSIFYYLVLDKDLPSGAPEDIAGYVITPKLHVEGTDDRMSFKAYHNQGTLTVQYSSDKQNWSTINYTGNVDTSFSDIYINGIPEGDWYIKFVLENICIDEVHGFTLAADTKTLALDEAATENQVVAGTYDEVTVAFTMQAGKFAAICLPFATTTTALGEGVKAWAFTGYDGNISLTTTNDLEAGKPYVVYAANGVNGFNFQNVTIASNEAGSVEQGAATFQGSYVKMPAGTMMGMYGVTPAGKIQKAGESATMKAFRGYFDLPTNTQNVKVSFDGIATGIDAAEVFGTENGEMYDLQGRRVNNAQKGIYIQNGKKFVVK